MPSPQRFPSLFVAVAASQKRPRARSESPGCKRPRASPVSGGDNPHAVAGGGAASSSNIKKTPPPVKRLMHPPQTNALHPPQTNAAPNNIRVFEAKFELAKKQLKNFNDKRGQRCSAEARAAVQKKVDDCANLLAAEQKRVGDAAFRQGVPVAGSYSGLGFDSGLGGSIQV